MAPSNRYTNLAQPDLVLTEYRFHIHSMEKGLQKLLQNLIVIQRSNKSYGTFESLL